MKPSAENVQIPLGQQAYGYNPIFYQRRSPGVDGSNDRSDNKCPTWVSNAGLTGVIDQRSFSPPAPQARECQIRKLVFAAASLSLLVGAPSMAAPCKDAKGRFTKWPAAPAKTVRCKSANGKFVKCSMAGAKPAEEWPASPEGANAGRPMS